MDAQSLTVQVNIAYPQPAQFAFAQASAGKHCNHFTLAHAARMALVIG